MVKLEDKVEKNRSKVLIFSIILFALICVVASYIKDKNSINVYEMKTITDDTALEFKNLSIVELGDKLYIEKGCTINIKEGANCDDVNGIDVGWYIDNKQIYSSSIEKVEGGTAEFINIPIIVRSVKMNSDSILTMKINYSMGGEEKEFKKDIKLKDCTSECAIYN